MRRISRGVVMSLAVALSGLGAADVTAQDQQPPPQQQFRAPTQISLCADFSLFSERTAFPTDFTLAGFRFHDAAGAPTLTAQSANGEGVLAFGPAGIGITLPAAVESLTVRVGAPDGPVDVTAYDANFAVLFETAVDQGDALSDVVLTGQGILYVSVGGTGPSGLLGNICFDTAIFPGGLQGGPQGGFGGGGAPAGQ